MYITCACVRVYMRKVNTQNETGYSLSTTVCVPVFATAEKWTLSYELQKWKYLGTVHNTYTAAPLYVAFVYYDFI